MTMLAAVASISAWGQGAASPQKAFDGYFECRTLAEHDVEVLIPSQEAVDSTCYLLGVNYGIMFKQNNFFDSFEQINIFRLLTGLETAMEVGEPANKYGIDEEWASRFEISPYEMNRVLNSFLAARREYTMELNRKTEKYFLIENAKREGVKQTESGLQYIIHSEGEGDKVAPADTVLVNYRGMLLDGTEFDANDSTEFVANQVIKGWTEGLGLLGKGGKITLFIPSELAFGENTPRGSTIEPCSLLVFEIELLEIKRKSDEEQE